MRIVFIGTVEFSQRTLEHLIAFGAQIEGVCTTESSGFNADHVDLSPLCERHDIPWIYVNDVNDAATLDWIRSRAPDVIFCFGWSRLLSSALLDLPRLGVVGYHPSALPANRGRHPIVWALVLGLTETASTFFIMDEGADSGDILSQQTVNIAPSDDARALYEKIISAACAQLDVLVPSFATRTFSRVKQDHRLANVWRKRGAADGKIDWRMSAQAVHNLVRGLARPYIGAEIEVRGQRIKIWKTIIVDMADANCEPGKVLSIDGSTVVVKCGEHAIALLETEPPFTAIKGQYL